jgi:rRNA maturation endonuclease Nob1
VLFDKVGNPIDIPSIQHLIRDFGKSYTKVMKAVIARAAKEVTPVQKENIVKKAKRAVPVQSENLAVTPKEIMIKEFIIGRCENCDSLIPQTSAFCPECGVKRQ